MLLDQVVQGKHGALTARPSFLGGARADPRRGTLHVAAEEGAPAVQLRDLTKSQEPALMLTVPF